MGTAGTWRWIPQNIVLMADRLERLVTAIRLGGYYHRVGEIRARVLTYSRRPLSRPKRIVVQMP